MERNDQISLIELLHLAYDAACAVSPVLIDFQDNGYRTEYKEDASPVTEADLEADRMITKALKGTEYLMVSEEGPRELIYKRPESNRFWVVDPLDGTKEFIAGRPDYTINIGLIEQGVPVLGVIMHPRENRAYLGLKGAGFIELEVGQEIPEASKFNASIPQKDIPFTAVVSRSHMRENTRDYLEELRVRHPDLKVTQAGSSLKFCKLALGEAHLYPRFAPCMIWDTAAGDAILRSVGKRIARMEDKADLDYVGGRLVNPPFIAGL